MYSKTICQDIRKDSNFTLLLIILFFSCLDIDECLYQSDPVCSQTCNNTIGSFICGCMTGYILRPDLRTCKAMGAPPTLLFANRQDIRQVNKTSNWLF